MSVPLKPLPVRLGGLALSLVGLVGACAGGGGPPRVTVLAASSLRDLLGGLEGRCEQSLGGVDVVFSFAASSALARRIGAGERFDVFLSADEASVERVLDRLEPDSRRVFLENRLALVVPADGKQSGGLSPRELPDHAGDIAIGAAAVPAGHYAREWLRRAGLLALLESRFRNARNVRAALTLVESGAAAFGFVYASDAAATGRVRTVWLSEAHGEPRIRFFAARARGASESAHALLAWLSGPEFLREAARERFLLPEGHER